MNYQRKVLGGFLKRGDSYFDVLHLSAMVSEATKAKKCLIWGHKKIWHAIKRLTYILPCMQLHLILLCQLILFQEMLISAFTLPIPILAWGIEYAFL